MKTFRLMVAALTFAAAAFSAAYAQQPGRPASQPAVVATGDAKIAIIDTEAFGDEKAGIGRLVSAMKGVENEFQPRRTELQNLNTRYTQLVEDIKKQQQVAAPDTLRQKADQAESLKTDIQRKQEDAQAAYQKRMGEVIAPVYDDIGKSLQAFARQRGISVIFDAAKLQGGIFLVNDAVDITRDFIAEYNRSHPATASVSRPGR